MQVVDDLGLCVRSKICCTAKCTGGACRGRQIRDSVFAFECACYHYIIQTCDRRDGAVQSRLLAQIYDSLGWRALRICAKYFLAGCIEDVIPRCGCQHISKLKMGKVGAMRGRVSSEQKEAVCVTYRRSPLLAQVSMLVTSKSWLCVLCVSLWRRVTTSPAHTLSACSVPGFSWCCAHSSRCPDSRTCRPANALA